ncbi:MAG: mechanosensitive ion channel family protein [Desulfurococcaceae archaeon]|uniref:Mechanosensitive ion channel family protein n=1 Tax=Staphylothermus marinus TaxID=2280 RepID=A0A7C4NR93_STAMA
MVLNYSLILQHIQANIGIFIKVVQAVAAIVIAYYLGNLVARRLGKAIVDVKPEVLHNFERLIKIIFTTIGVAVALTIIGIDVSSLILAAGFAGIVIGLAAQQVLSHLFSGLSLIAEKRIRVGDIIMIGENTGIVESVGLMSTRIRLFSGEVLTVPNTDLMSSRIYNYSEPKARRIEIPITISYESNLDKAISLIKELLEQDEYILSEPPPIVFVEKLGESGVDLKILFWVPSMNYWEVRRRIVKEIKETLEKAGIEIPYPRRVIWIKQLSNNIESSRNMETTS